MAHNFGRRCPGWPLCGDDADTLRAAGEEYRDYVAQHPDDDLASALAATADLIDAELAERHDPHAVASGVMTATMTRARLRRVLTEAGVRAGPKHDGERATIVDFVDSWGVMPGVPGSGTAAPDIKRALDAAGVRWRMGNMVLVPKMQELRPPGASPETADRRRASEACAGPDDTTVLCIRCERYQAEQDGKCMPCVQGIPLIEFPRPWDLVEQMRREVVADAQLAIEGEPGDPPEPSL